MPIKWLKFLILEILTAFEKIYVKIKTKEGDKLFLAATEQMNEQKEL